tara:strand:- start:256 stop:927 length:672 start_codon:yes stop_codon:yes gene_type:complete
MKHNILYTFRRCPYAIRARWALLNTKQEVELREVDLNNKPSELIEISKKATVPVLNTNSNQVIDESIDIMIWAIKRSNLNEIIGENKTSTEKQIFSLIETNDKIFKYHLDRFKYASRYKDKSPLIHRDAGLKILISLNERLQNISSQNKSLFLVDAKESLADWAIWPFVRQFRIADKINFDSNDEIKYLRIWLNYFLSHKNYSKVMKKNEPWRKNNDPIFFGK